MGGKAVYSIQKNKIATSPVKIEWIMMPFLREMRVGKELSSIILRKNVE